MNKETFCPAPWMHLHVINDGRAFPCCMTPIEDKYSFGNVKEQSLLEIMNDPKAKEMRLGMLQNKPLPPSCHRCTEKEAVNMNSMRKGMVDKYAHLINQQVTNTKEDGSVDELKLLYWDFRFSNYCNLSCRTCGPIFSTSWAKDAKVLWKSTVREAALIDLKDATNFWNDLYANIDSVDEIHFAGGEPVLMEEHWRLTDMLIEKNLLNTRLKYSTNATTLTYKGRNILDVWKKFKHVHVSVSVDGAYDTFDYVRNRGKWPETEEVLTAIKNSGVEFWIHPTISILNIYRLTELHDKLLEMNIVGDTKKNFADYFITQFHLNPLFSPEYYSLTSLPKHHKLAVEEMLRTYADKMFVEHAIPKKGWLSIIDFMNSADTTHQWNRFVDMTKQLDSIRQQEFLKINPEFKDEFTS